MRWFANQPKNPPARLLPRDEQTSYTPMSKMTDLSLLTANYLVVDIETTGFSAERDQILSVAAAKMVGLHSEFEEFVYRFIQVEHVQEVPDAIWELTGLTPQQLKDGQPLEVVLNEVLVLAVNHVWIAHHARHELSFFQRHAWQLWKLRLRPIVIDTSVVAQALCGLSRAPTLDAVCEWLDIPITNRHQADADVRMTAEIWRKEALLCKSMGLTSVAEVIDWTYSRAMG